MKAIKVRNSILRTIGLGVLGVCLSSVAFGQCSVAGATCFGINGFVGSFTSPYTGGVYVTGDPAPAIQIICDDFADHVSGDQQWSALVTDLSAFGDQNPQTLQNTVNTVYYTGNSTLTQTQEYVAAASLAVQIDSLPFPFSAGDSEPQRDELSAALWNIFQPGSITLTDPTQEAAVIADLNNAEAVAVTDPTGASFEFNSGYDVTIYTPTLDGITPNPNTFNNPGSDNAPQEFITVTYVPEPSMSAILGIDLFGAAIAGLYFRRRQTRSRS